MSEPFLGEIALFGFSFPPRGWALCDGQILPINQNQALYALLGTTYGGDGRTSFALPDLRGRVPIHAGSSGAASHPLGQRSGEETHALTTQEMASHNHPAACTSTPGDQKAPDGRIPAVDSEGLVAVYGAGATTPMAADAVTSAGSGQGHQNMQPFLTLNFSIALSGLFPSRN